jgi:hypothetical protein
MEKLTKVYKTPSALDSGANYIGQTPDSHWLVLLGRNRDSDILTNTNWDVAIERLGGVDNENVYIESMGHWLCGWVEYLCVSENAPKELIDEAQEIEDSLESYPVLDDERLSEAEQTEADRLWKDWYSPAERVEYIRKNSYEFEFRDWQDVAQCVRGKYFAGYASELLN